MKDISTFISNRSSDIEIIWDEIRYKVILFKNGNPVSYVDLKDQENDMEHAIKFASVLANNGGIKLV